MTKTTERRKIPIAQCRLRGDFIKMEIAAAAPAADGKKARTFRLVANTGKPMYLGWYWGDLVIDLSGVAMKAQLPVLLDHMTSCRVGFTKSTKVEDGAIVAEGQMLDPERNEYCREVLVDADAGFPWQCSVGFEPELVQVLSEGEVAEVNGSSVSGPMKIARRGTLREVSFCALGADDDTSADVAAGAATSVECEFEHEAQEPMDKETKTPTTLSAADVQKAHPAQVAELCASAASAAAQAAVGAERERASSILAACGDGQLKLGVDLVKEGVSASTALERINKDLREKLAAAKAGTIDGSQSTKSTEGGNTGADAEVDPKGELRASFPQDERGQKAYEAYVRNRKNRAS